jgi:hypothetical protein
VNRAAKDYGVPQKTFERYVKAMSLPDFDLALRMAREAQIDEAEAFKILAAEAAARKGLTAKIAEGFKKLVLLAKPRRDLIPAW